MEPFKTDGTNENMQATDGMYQLMRPAGTARRVSVFPAYVRIILTFTPLPLCFVMFYPFGHALSAPSGVVQATCNYRVLTFNRSIGHL